MVNEEYYVQREKQCNRIGLSCIFSLAAGLSLYVIGTLALLGQIQLTPKKVKSVLEGTVIREQFLPANPSGWRGDSYSMLIRLSDGTEIARSFMGRSVSREMDIKYDVGDPVTVLRYSDGTNYITGEEGISINPNKR